MGQVNLAQHIIQDIAKWAKYHLAQKISLKSGPSKVLGPFLHVTSSNAKLVSCVFFHVTGSNGGFWGLEN